MTLRMQVAFSLTLLTILCLLGAQFSSRWYLKKRLSKQGRQLRGGYASIKREADTEARIVGGRPVPRDKYPFFGLPASTLLCGSTLIHDDMLLSAGHCEGAFSAGAFVGGIRLDGEGSIFVEVEEEIVHPKYEKETFLNDIMIVKLRDSVPLPFVQLNFSNDLPRIGNYVSAVGFGEVFGRNDRFSQELLEVSVPVLGHEKCSRHFKGSIDDKTMLCAGGEKGRDSCTGDSGGPLLSANKEQIGIVSYGDGCAQAGVPAVYTRVSAFQKWLTETICKRSNFPPSSCRSQEMTSGSKDWAALISNFNEANAAESFTEQDLIETVFTNTLGTSQPSEQPTKTPLPSTTPPSLPPTQTPSIKFTSSPSTFPTDIPYSPTTYPTHFPSRIPFTTRPVAPSQGLTLSSPATFMANTTTLPTSQPSKQPTKTPLSSKKPSSLPPTQTPSIKLTSTPSTFPTHIHYSPTMYPTHFPTKTPIMTRPVATLQRQTLSPSATFTANKPISAVSIQQFMLAADEAFSSSVQQILKTPFSTNYPFPAKFVIPSATPSTEVPSPSPATMAPSANTQTSPFFSGLMSQVEQGFTVMSHHPPFSKKRRKMGVIMKQKMHKRNGRPGVRVHGRARPNKKRS